MSRAKISAKLRQRIAEQAKHRCGYCLTSEKLTGIRLTIDHIIPLAAEGHTQEENLWLACRPCNEFKGIHTHALDPESGERVMLFNPRTQIWEEHFTWGEDGAIIIGITPIGRTTVSALQMNHDLIVYARRQWIKVGWHPPED